MPRHTFTRMRCIYTFTRADVAAVHVCVAFYIVLPELFPSASWACCWNGSPFSEPGGAIFIPATSAHPCSAPRRSSVYRVRSLEIITVAKSKYGTPVSGYACTDVISNGRT